MVGEATPAEQAGRPSDDSATPDPSQVGERAVGWATPAQQADQSPVQPAASEPNRQGEQAFNWAAPAPQANQSPDQQGERSPGPVPTEQARQSPDQLPTPRTEPTANQATPRTEQPSQPLHEPATPDQAGEHTPGGTTPVEQAQRSPDEPDFPEPPAGVDGPTVAQPVEPARVETGTSVDGPTIAEAVEASRYPAFFAVGGPTAAYPVDVEPLDEPTIAAPVQAGDSVDGPTVAEPVAADTSDPATDGWPLDQFEVALPPAPGRQATPTTRTPAYYVTLGAAVVLVVGLVAVAAFVSVVRPRQAVAGSGSAEVPVISSSTQAPPPPSTTTGPAPAGPYKALAEHPLSTAATRMPDATCALPRFDPADDKQAAFFTAAKTCADDAWRPVLQEAGLDGQVNVVTVTGPVQTRSCGELAPTSPATQCDGTVYLTPAHLRDTEQNGRYPGRYLGVFFREYARALQFVNGLDQLTSAVPDGDAADLDTRLDQQATCMAGITSGAMAGRGAVDGNITGEIRQRLSSVDAPPDAQSLLDKGFQQRTPAACNTWAK
ncbi:hypothetical protein [Actinophytocola oryzae]|nr:hypothetical protein [Actinophytocola oryzae]